MKHSCVLCDIYVQKVLHHYTSLITNKSNIGKVNDSVCLSVCLVCHTGYAVMWFIDLFKVLFKILFTPNECVTAWKMGVGPICS